MLDTAKGIWAQSRACPRATGAMMRRLKGHFLWIFRHNPSRKIEGFSPILESDDWVRKSAPFFSMRCITCLLPRTGSSPVIKNTFKFHTTLSQNWVCEKFKIFRIPIKKYKIILRSKKTTRTWLKVGHDFFLRYGDTVLIFEK